MTLRHAARLAVTCLLLSAQSRAQPADTADVVRQAAALPIAPACTAMVAHAASMALSQTAPDDGARTLAVHDLLLRTVRLCPSPALAPYWTKLSQAAARQTPKPTQAAAAAPIPQQDLAAVRHIVAGLNLRPDCQAALEEAAGDTLAQATGAPGLHPAALLGSYTVLICPEAALDKLWPALELAYSRIQAG